MKKFLLGALFCTIASLSFAGSYLEYEIEGSNRAFMAQNNNLKIITGKSTPWMLFDLKNSKIYIVQDDEKKYVEMTKAELNNMVNAAGNLEDAFGKGKIDLKALTKKKKKDGYQNPYSLVKAGSDKKAGDFKGTEYSIQAAKVTTGTSIFSTELEKALGKDLDYTKTVKQILDITTTKVVLDKLDAPDRILVGVLDAGLKLNKAGMIAQVEKDSKTLLKIVKVEKQDFAEGTFVVPKDYVKKSIKDFLK